MKMNLKISIVLFMLFVTFPLSTFTREMKNCFGEKSIVCAPERRTNASHNHLHPRQMIKFDDVRSLLDAVLRYVRQGFNFLIEHFAPETGPRKKRVSYKGYQVFRIHVVDEKQVKHLEELPEEIDGTEFWTPPVENYHTDLLVAPDALSDVREYLKEKDVDHEVLIRDLQKVIAFENPKMNKNQRELLIGKRGHPMTWMRYHRYSDMIRYMEFLAFTYPHLVDLMTIGYTSEGLPLKVIRVSSESNGGESDAEDKPAFWIDGGMHGSEWITSAVVLYLIKQFVENYHKHKETVNSAVWYFLPVANPDGYEYSHSTDRLWRKTRSKHDVTESNFIKKLLFGSCEGVDLNRNFDFHWGEGRVSENPCRELYAGPKPFSEPETKAISSFIMNKKEKLKMYITLHSYSQMWLVPWSYTTKKTSDYDEMVKMAKKAAEAIALVTGSHYDVGSGASLVYPASGSAEDWAKGVAGIKYSYAVKLRDRGSFGFLLPAAQILPTAKEMFIAVKVMARMIIGK